MEEILEKNLNDVVDSCGIAPEGIAYIDPGNDPNFIFKQDPTFEIVTLYDADGNIANMNSWFECAHYVNGGWNNIQIINYQGDKFLFFAMLAIAVAGSVLYFLDIRKKYDIK